MAISKTWAAAPKKRSDAGVYLSTGLAHYEGDIKIFSDGGKIVLNAEKRLYPLGFAALWVPEMKVLGGNLGLSLGSSDIFSWADGEVTGLINAEATVEGWAFGDTTVRAQLGRTSGAWSNTLYLTTWFPTGRHQRGFRPNTGKNHYGVNLGWGVTYTESHTELEFDSAIGVTFNAKNPATDCKDGDDFILDWAVGKKFANGLEVDVAGYAYQQLTGDSGSGAKLGPFKGRVFAVAPHVVYNTVDASRGAFQFSQLSRVRRRESVRSQRHDIHDDRKVLAGHIWLLHRLLSAVSRGAEAEGRRSERTGWTRCRCAGYRWPQ